jgi:hypothetical protein
MQGVGTNLGTAARGSGKRKPRNPGDGRMVQCYKSFSRPFAAPAVSHAFRRALCQMVT